MAKGQLYIVAAPSGAGKTSLLHAFLTDAKNIAVSISHTTRPIRRGEQNEIDYHFVDVETFQTMIEQQEFLEYAQVFDHFYGTSKLAVTQLLDSGQDVILEIDWQGAQQVRQLMPTCQSIFILPPSRQALLERLRARGQDDEAVIARRMQEVGEAVAHHQEFDYVIINDNFANALADMQAIIRCQRLTQAVQVKAYPSLLADLL